MSTAKEQLSLMPMFYPNEGQIGSRVRCLADVADVRRRAEDAHDREFGWRGGLRLPGPFPCMGAEGVVQTIKAPMPWEFGGGKTIVVRFDGEACSRFMTPDLLEVLS